MTMDYGRQAEPPEPGRREYKLWQKALARVALVAGLWAPAALTLHAVVPDETTIDLPRPGPNVTTTLPPRRAASATP